MMLLLLAILGPSLVLGSPLEMIKKNFILDIRDDVLMGVKLTGEINDELNLSGLKLRNLDKNAFDNLDKLKSLNLARNSFKQLPDFIFSNMTNLVNLSLAENQIESVKYLFVGLENLKCLNLSYNPIKHLRRGHLFGLTRSAYILTEGNVFWSMSTGVFANSFLKDEEELKELEKMKNQPTFMHRHEEKEKELDIMVHDTQNALEIQKSRRNARQLSKRGLRMKVCITENIVTVLGFSMKEEIELPKDCRMLMMNEEKRIVGLGGLGIKGVQKGWYQLHEEPIASIDLSNNEISEISKELINDLPEDLIYLNLMGNKIRRIWSDIIDNQHIKMLNLKDNLIEDIEMGALKNTQLTGLFLTGNQLEDLHFISSLPKTMSELVISGNGITKIPQGVFNNLPKLNYLNFGNNRIEKLSSNVFKGLDSLQILIMTRNNLIEIEDQAFMDLKNLKTLYLFKNSLRELKSKVFADLTSLKDLNLAWNKISIITKDQMKDLPKSLDLLYLDSNEIERMETESFVDVPRITLSLNENKISHIPHGAFKLPNLRDLYLNKNKIEFIDADSYEGLLHLKQLWLSDNLIAEIRKGACRNFASLNVLNISKNPFKHLDNGALHGLTTAKGNFIYIHDNQLKFMQGGLFDDV